MTDDWSSDDHPTSPYPEDQTPPAQVGRPQDGQPPGSVQPSAYGGRPVYGQPPGYDQLPAYGQPPPPRQPSPYDRSPVPYPPGYQVAPKNPAISLLASFFIPGLGSMINGEAGKGIGILVGYLVSAVLVLVLIGIVGMLAFWIWGMVDAYQGAQKWNSRHGIIS